MMQRAADEGWYAKEVEGGLLWFRRKKKVPKKKRCYVPPFRNKQSVPDTEGPGYHPVDDPRFVARYPALFEYVCVPPVEGDLSSLTASLTLFSEDGQIKACLNDRHTQTVCFVTNTTLEGVLSLLDAQLQEGAAEWRVSKTAKPKKK